MMLVLHFGPVVYEMRGMWSGCTYNGWEWLCNGLITESFLQKRHWSWVFFIHIWICTKRQKEKLLARYSHNMHWFEIDVWVSSKKWNPPHQTKALDWFGLIVTVSMTTSSLELVWRLLTPDSLHCNAAIFNPAYVIESSKTINKGNQSPLSIHSEMRRLAMWQFWLYFPIRLWSIDGRFPFWFFLLRWVILLQFEMECCPR